MSGISLISVGFPWGKLFHYVNLATERRAFFGYLGRHRRRQRCGRGYRYASGRAPCHASSRQAISINSYSNDRGRQRRSSGRHRNNRRGQARAGSNDDCNDLDGARSLSAADQDVFDRRSNNFQGRSGRRGRANLRVSIILRPGAFNGWRTSRRTRECY